MPSLAEAVRNPRADEFAAKGWWTGDTLDAWLAKHAAERPAAPALVHGSRVLSWRDLADAVSRAAATLARAGVGPGDVMAMQLPNIPEYAIAYLATCRLGAAVSTIHMPYRAAELENLLAHSGAKVAVVLSNAKDWSPADTVRGLMPKLPALKHVIPPEALVGDATLDEASVPRPSARDAFLLLYTSGTTAAPKGVAHPYASILANVRLGAPEHRLGPEDRILTAAPLTHLFGMYSFLLTMYTGATSVLLPMFTPPELAEVVGRDKPTALWTAPAHMAACRNMGLFAKHDWSSLKLAIISGSACPPELARWVQEQLPGCAVTQLWGMTETQAGLYTRPGDGIDVSATSTGRASPGTEIRIVDDAGRPAPAGTEGELQTRGCALFTGYVDNPAATRAAFTDDGWFRTGDLARMDAAGNVALTGRIKDVINRGGVKFNPSDVETLLESHPKVMQAAIVPMPDAVLGEKACCFVTLKPGAQAPALEELCAWLAERKIAKIKLPERLVVIDEMPLTPTRKVIKGRLRIPS